jgi:ATP-dependent protease ClpP protease subunit
MAFKERYMTQNAYFMVHEDSISGLEGAKVSQIEKEAQHARRIEDLWTTLFPETQKLNYLDWAYLHREETYFNAEECLAHGIIKGIV